MRKDRSRFGLMLAAAWAALLWERLLAAFLPALLVAGTFLIALLSGVLMYLPPAVRWGVLAGFGLAMLAALVRGFRVRLPGDEEASGWLDRRNPEGGRAAASWLDQLPADRSSPAERAIWEAHRARIERRIAGYRVGLPQSPLPARDPYALRNAVALGLIATVLVAGVPVANRVAELAKTPAGAARQASLDLWVSPPQYTGKPPILLAAAARTDTGEERKPVSVPEGSKLTARTANTSAPVLTLVPLAGEALPAIPFAVDASGNGEAQAVIDRSVRLDIRDGSSMLGSFALTVIEDSAPTVAIVEPLEITRNGQMAIPWTAADDYGIVSLEAQVAMAPPGTNADAPVVSPDSPFLSKPPSFAVALPALNPKSAKGKAFQDLTEHYWAGLDVTLTFTAADQAGQKGTSNQVALRLPERGFSVPLARGLAEQRMVLIRTPQRKDQVVRTLAAFMAWPDGLFPTSGSYLAVQDVTTDLYTARTDDDTRAVIDNLWKIAIAIEDGSVDATLKDLEEARRELQKAIAEGAPPDKIAELTQKLREAMNRYLEAMREQMMERMRRGDMERQERPDQVLRQQDLQKMLDQIENLAKSGSRDAAQELLAQLENMLKNMQPMMSQQGGDQEGPMGQMLDQLGQMMRDQQRLMDETFRMDGQMGQQGQQGQQGEGEEGQQGQQRGQGQGRGQGRSGDQLSQDQQGLGQALQEMMRQLGEMGMESPQGMNRAGRSMGEAADALRNGNREGALQAQNDALQGLREGARSMADQMMQQGQGNEGRYGRNGRSRGDDRDPLGRPMPHTGEDYGPEQDMVPGEAAVERARRILEFLRNRAGEPGRPKVELDYLERLL